MRKNPASKCHASWAFQAVAIWTDRNASPVPIRVHRRSHLSRQSEPKRSSPPLVPESDRQVPPPTNEPASRSILKATLPAKTLRCSPASENGWSTRPLRYPPENPCHSDNSFFSVAQAYRWTAESTGYVFLREETRYPIRPYRSRQLRLQSPKLDTIHDPWTPSSLAGIEAKVKSVKTPAARTYKSSWNFFDFRCRTEQSSVPVLPQSSAATSTSRNPIISPRYFRRTSAAPLPYQPEHSRHQGLANENPPCKRREDEAKTIHPAGRLTKVASPPDRQFLHLVERLRAAKSVPAAKSSPDWRVADSNR